MTNRLIFVTGIPILVRRHLYSEASELWYSNVLCTNSIDLKVIWNLLVKINTLEKQITYIRLPIVHNFGANIWRCCKL